MNKVSTLDYMFKLFLCLNKPNVMLLSFILEFYPLFRAYFLQQGGRKKWLATWAGFA